MDSEWTAVHLIPKLCEAMSAMDSEWKAVHLPKLSVALAVQLPMLYLQCGAIKAKLDTRKEEVVRQMLKGLTPAQFVQLPDWERYQVYYKHLVNRNAFVQIDEDSDVYSHFNPEITQGNVLRQEWYMGDDAAGQKIVREARSVYYKNNSFEVPLHWLGEFLFDGLAVKPTKIEGLIRNIAVSIRVDQSKDDKYSSMDRSEEEETETVLDLRRLFSLEDADVVEILVRGGGALDGSDRQTRAKLKDIFPIVKELIGEFEEVFSIRNVYHVPDDKGNTYHDLTPYFSGDKLNVRKGKAAHQWGWESWPVPQEQMSVQSLRTNQEEITCLGFRTEGVQKGSDVSFHRVGPWLTLPCVKGVFRRATRTSVKSIRTCKCSIRCFPPGLHWKGEVTGPISRGFSF